MKLSRYIVALFLFPALAAFSTADVDKTDEETKKTITSLKSQTEEAIHTFQTSEEEAGKTNDIDEKNVLKTEFLAVPDGCQVVNSNTVSCCSNVEGLSACFTLRCESGAENYDDCSCSTALNNRACDSCDICDDGSGSFDVSYDCTNIYAGVEDDGCSGAYGAVSLTSVVMVTAAVTFLSGMIAM